jgi:hypothetical protein
MAKDLFRLSNAFHYIRNKTTCNLHPRDKPCGSLPFLKSPWDKLTAGSMILRPLYGLQFILALPFQSWCSKKENRKLQESEFFGNKVHPWPVSNGWKQADIDWLNMDRDRGQGEMIIEKLRK